MKTIDSKKWFISYIIVFVIILLFLAGMIVAIDPFFHYHKPLNFLYYDFSGGQRYINDGITKHFDYDAIITGTSMTENFRASEVDSIYDVHSIKVPFSGGSYKEMNDNLAKGYESGHNIKVIIRGLDYGRLLDAPDAMRYDLGTYPLYLYDDNLFNDAKYVLNQDVLSRCAYMLRDFKNKKEGGIADFDTYSYWMGGYINEWGRKGVIGDRHFYADPEEINELSEEDKDNIKKNITQNVTSLAKQHPETTFYYFFSPYSAAQWGSFYESGDLNRMIDAEEEAIKLILEVPNIKLFSFNNCKFTNNIYNYKDASHYGEWINSYMLRKMHEGKCLLTKENYEKYLKEERELRNNFNYDYLCRYQDIKTQPSTGPHLPSGKWG